MITLYNKKKIILCQFCNNFYTSLTFKEHLYKCENYIKYIKRNILPQIKWKEENFTKNPNLFKNLLENKRVIIVGPSITTQKSNLGSFIESFDIIVRLNKSLPVPKRLHKHIGRRTDILYNSLNTTDYPGENNINPYFLKSQKIKYLRCSYPPISPFRRDIVAFYRKNKKNIVNFGHIETKYYNKIIQKLNTRPYTGTSAICDLLQYNLKELFIMGLDFYTYKHSNYYRKITDTKLRRLQNNSIHKRNPQINLISRFYLLDNRITVDNVLTDILLNKYDYFCYEFRNIFSINDIFIKKTFVNKKIKIIKKSNYKLFIETNNNKLYVYRNTDNYRHSNVLITEKYQNYDNNYNYIQPTFIYQLKRLLERYIFKRGSLCFEMFVVLIFSLFNQKTYIKNIDIYPEWYKSNNLSQIEQRLLFNYLLNKKMIKII